MLGMSERSVRSISVQFYSAILMFLALVCPTTRSVEAVEVSKTISFPTLQTQLDGQLQVPEVLTQLPAWLLSDQQSKQVSPDKFDLPVGSTINSARMEFGVSVSAFPSLFASVRPSSAETDLRSSRVVAATVTSSDTRLPIPLFGHNSRTRMQRLYRPPYPNTSME